MAAPVKFVVFGASGLIGIRHLGHVVEEPEAELTAIVDPMPAGEKLAVENKVPIFKDIDSFLKAREAGEVQADAAILGTPTQTHAPLGLQLVNAGIHTLVEKPVSTDSISARELVKAASGKAKIIVGHHRRFNPYMRETKALVESGSLGQILAFQGVWCLLKPREYFSIPWRQQFGVGGPILTNLVHEIDNLRYLFGDIVRVYVEEGAKTRGFTVEETLVMTLSFESGTVGTFVLSDAVASPFSWEMSTGENPNIPASGQPCYVLFGTKGSIAVPELTRFHYDSYKPEDGHWGNPIEKDASIASKIDDVPPFTRQLRHFIAVVRGTEEPNCSGREGLAALLVLEAVFKSLESKLPVTVETTGV